MALASHGARPTVGGGSGGVGGAKATARVQARARRRARTPCQVETIRTMGATLRRRTATGKRSSETTRQAVIEQRSPALLPRALEAGDGYG